MKRPPPFTPPLVEVWLNTMVLLAMVPPSLSRVADAATVAGGEVAADGVLADLIAVGSGVEAMPRRPFERAVLGDLVVVDAHVAVLAVGVAGSGSFVEQHA